MRKGLLAAVVFGIALFPGCTALNEYRDPWLRSETIDFKTQGAVFGEMSIEAAEAGNWEVQSSLQDVNSGKKYPINQSRDGFFLTVPEGKYQFYFYRIHQSYPEKWIDWKSSSKPFDVKAGEAVYTGDLMISLGKSFKSDLGDIPLKSLAEALADPKVKINYGTKDRSYEKLKILKARHPGKDYEFAVRLMEFDKE